MSEIEGGCVKSGDFVGLLYPDGAWAPGDDERPLSLVEGRLKLSGVSLGDDYLSYAWGELTVRDYDPSLFARNRRYRLRTDGGGAWRVTLHDVPGSARFKFTSSQLLGDDARPRR